MRIVVCLHGTTGGAGPTGRDADALALALGVGGGHEVVALVAGNDDEAGPLEVALASGAARAVRVIGEDFATADFHALGQMLAVAVRRLEADVVLAGAHSSDEGLGAVSAFLARHAAMAHVSRIESLAFSDQGPVVTVRGGGRRRTLRVTPPVVLSVAGAPGELRDRIAREPLATAVGGAAIEKLSLVDPEATVVRRRTDLLGTPEVPARSRVTVQSPAELLKALTR